MRISLSLKGLTAASARANLPSFKAALAALLRINATYIASVSFRDVPGAAAAAGLRAAAAKTESRRQLADALAVQAVVVAPETKFSLYGVLQQVNVAPFTGQLASQLGQQGLGGVDVVAASAALVTAAPTPSPSPDPTPAPSPPAPTHVAPGVDASAAAAGTVAGLVALLAGALLYRWRRDRKRIHDIRKHWDQLHQQAAKGLARVGPEPGGDAAGVGGDGAGAGFALPVHDEPGSAGYGNKVAPFPFPAPPSLLQQLSASAEEEDEQQDEKIKVATARDSPEQSDASSATSDSESDSGSESSSESSSESEEEEEESEEESESGEDESEDEMELRPPARLTPRK